MKIIIILPDLSRMVHVFGIMRFERE